MKPRAGAKPRARRRGLAARVGSRARTVGQLIGHFARGQRFFLIPLLLVLLVAAALLVLTGGLSYVAPFVYTIF